MRNDQPLPIVRGQVRAGQNTRIPAHGRLSHTRMGCRPALALPSSLPRLFRSRSFPLAPTTAELGGERKFQVRLSPSKPTGRL